MNGAERGAEAGRVFFKDSCMERNAGDLTAEESEGRCKQDKIMQREIDHCHLCAHLRLEAALLLLGVDRTTLFVVTCPCRRPCWLVHSCVFFRAPDSK